MHPDAGTVRRAVEAMNPSLRGRYETIRSILAASAEDIVVRHRIGKVIAQIQNDPNKYGARAVTLVAAALGRDETSLYRCAHVATRWTSEDMARLAGRRNRRGELLSWSHLVRLSTVATKRVRDALLERVLAEALSVREIARLAAGVQDARAGASTLRTRSIARLERRLRDAGSIGARLDEMLADLDQMLAGGGILPAEARRVAELARRLRIAHEAVTDKNGQVLERLDALGRRATASD